MPERTLKWERVTKGDKATDAGGVYRLVCGSHHILTLRVELPKAAVHEGELGTGLKFEITYRAPADTLGYLDGTDVPALESGPLRIPFKPFPWPAEAPRPGP